MAEDRIKKLYDTFVADGYDMESEEDFRNNLGDAEKRKKVYDTLVEDGYDMEDFNTFETNLGFTQPYYPASVPNPQAQEQAYPEGIVKAESDKKVAEQEAQKTAEEEEAKQRETWEKNAPEFVKSLNNKIAETRRFTHDTGNELSAVGRIKSSAEAEYERQIAEIDRAERIGAISPQEAFQKRMAAKTNLGIALTPKDFEIRQSNARQVAELSKDIDEKMIRLGRELDASTPTIMMPTTAGAMVNFDSGRLSDKTYRTYAAAKRSLEDAQKIIDEADHRLREGNYNEWQKSWLAGVGRGAADKLFDVRTWDMGLSEMSDASVLLSALDKVDNGEELTDAERSLLDAKAVEMATNAYFGSYLGRGYTAGTIAAESLPFMIEMAINPLSALGKSAQSKLVRYALKKFGKGLYQRKLKYNAIKYGTRLLGDLAGSAGMTLTTSMPRTTMDAYSRQVGQVKPKYDEYGRAIFGGTEGGVSEDQAWRQAITAGTLERFSEMMSYYFPSMGKVLSKPLDQPSLKVINTFIDNVSHTDLARWTKEFAKKTRWDGPISEYFEEVGNNILNGIFVGDMQFDTSEQGIFNLDNNINTLQGVALIGGSVAAINTAYYPIYKYTQSRKLNKADREAGEAFGEEWEGIRSTLSSIGDSSKNALRELMLRDDMTPMQKRAAAEYFFANGAYHAAQEASIKRMIDENTSPEEIEVSQSYEVGRNLTSAEDMNEAKLEYEAQLNNMRNMFALGEDGDVDAFLGDDPLGDVRRSMDIGGTEAEAQAKLNYLNAKATYEGMLDQAEENIKDEVERTMAQIDKQANKKLNGIQQVTLNNGEEVFVLDGVVGMDAEGNINRDTTDDNIIYLGQDGKAHFAPKSDIASAKPFVDINTYKQQTRDQIVSVRSDEAVAKIDGVQPMNMGNTFKVMDEQGLMHEATITGAFEDGSVAVSFDGAEPQQMQRDAVQSMADAFKMAELQEKKAMQEQKERAEMEQVEAQLQEDKKAQEAEQPKPTALSRIPQDENGQPMYEEADADTAWDAIVEKANGNEATAQRVADAAVKKAEKALNEVAESTLNEDMSIDEMIEAENAHNDAIAKAQANLDKWKEIAATPQRRAEAAQRQSEQQAQAEAMQERIDKANEAVAEEQNETKEQRERKIKELQSKIQEWLSVENVSWAEGRTLNESIEKFGNDVEPIAILPTVIKKYFPELTSLYLYSGKGYLIDHAANHHPELSADEYNNIQQTLDEYDDIKDLSTSTTKKVAFIKMLEKGYAVVTELSEKDGKIMLHKTFFYKDAQGKRTPYKNKPSLLKKTSVDGSTTISPAETAAGRHRNISALDASSENKDTTSEPQMQETLQEKSSLQKKMEQRMRMSKARAAQQGGRFMQENTELGAPIDFLDHVMRAIATGGIRFIWRNNPRTGTRGLGAHTGFDEMERRKRIGILSNENGYYPEVAAEELLQSYAAEIGYTPNIDTSDALSTILDVVMTYTTPKEMMEAAQARHAEAAAREAGIAERDAEEEYYHMMAAEHNMSVFEYMDMEAAYEELKNEELEARDAVKEEIDAIFVEHYLEEDYDNERRNQSLHQGVSGQTRSGESNEGGSGVLSSAQADNTRAARRSAEGQGTTAQVSNEGDGDISASQTLGEQESAAVSDESVPFRATEATQPTGKKLSRAANMLRIPLRKRINAWSRKVGVPVVMLEDFNEAPNDIKQNIISAAANGQRVTGWVSDGKVYFYMPMLRDINDIDDTYIHEVVAHKGMDAMLGKEEYRKYCLDVFNNLMTEAERKFYLDYEGVRTVTDEESHKAKAADEYIAHLSESTNLNKREASVWNKIVDLFRKMLEALGFPQKISKLAVEDMIRQSYRNLLENKDALQEKGKTQFSVKDNSDTERVPRLNKHRVENIFGGIWIDNPQEFAKFVSAVDNYVFEENGEGIAYTDNYFYAYYRNIDGQVIPFASVYLNANESQDVVNRVNQELANNAEQRRVREYFDRAYELARNIKSENNAIIGSDKGASYSRRNDSLGSNISRKGRYYDFPSLYVKTQRTDRDGLVNNTSFRVAPAMDALYMEAVERGDMAMAQRMVQEAAEHAGYIPDTSYQGSLAFNGAAPTINVYFETKEERKQAWDNDEFDDTMSLGDYADNGIDTNDLEWRLTDPGNYRRATQYEKESIDNINKALKNPEHKITIYRAIPNSVEEGSIRNGDWVTPSRSYAEYHIGLQDWNGGRVIEQEVSLDDIWWGGNDINEWGYDDGSNYGYRNTKNNRKLLDTVVYDDAGNIIPLSERFNPDKADVRFSVKDNHSLVGVHNLSLDKLRKTIKMGGLANPSVAVIDADKQTHEDYGEYSLILPKDMVDARQGKNAGTWAGDAWTPTYPQITKRMSKDKDISRFYKDIDTLPESIRGRVRLDFDSFMDGRSANALAYWYLFDKGLAPELVNVPARYPSEVVDALNEATNGSFSMYRLSAEERAKCVDAFVAYKYDGDRAAYDADMAARKERLENFAKNHDKAIVRKKAQEDLDSINEYGFDYDEISRFIHDVEWDVRHKGEIDVDATVKASMDYIAENNLGAEYDAWRNNLEERYGIEEYIFDGYTNSGTPRYLPHTVENASKWMKKQGRQGAVATFPSFGTFVAVSIPKMTTLDSIRKRKNLLGKPQEEYDAFREKWENVYFELGKKLQPDAKGFDDYGYWRLIEAVGQKNPKEYIKKQYNIELSNEDVNTLNEILNAIRTEYPARYFETKFERSLQLNDFVAAVVPDDVPMDVWGRLNDANVKIFEYKKGDNNSRAEAMQKATATEDVRFRISPIGGYTAEEVIDIITPEIENILNENGVDNAAIAEVWLHGSRMRGDAKRNSDLDAVLFYKGDAREDDLFNIIADNAITIDGVKVDVNPIQIDSEEDIARYKQKSQQYDREKLSATNNPRFRVADDTAAEKEQIITEAKANGTHLKAPNGKPTNLTPKQWVMVRTKAFKKWFGDWEKAARIEKLRKSEDAKITGNEIEASEDLKQYKRNAQMYGRTLQGKYTNADTGAVISLQRGRHNGGINEVLQHNYKDIAHLQSVAAIPQIIENGIYIESQPDNNTETNPDVTEYQMFVCGLNIGGEDYTVLAKVAVDNRGNRYYDHNLVSVEKGKLIDIANNEQSATSSGFGTTPDTESTTNSQYKFKELISILQTNSSKIVDANGEPKVVEHSTWNDDFYTFDMERLGESSGDEGVYGAGFYFGNIGETEIYGDRKIQTCLNMRNPLVLPEAPILGFFDYLVENFDKDGLRDIVVKQGNKATTIGNIVDAIKAVNEAHAQGEYAELIEQMSEYWYPAEDRVLEQQIFRKIGLAVYPTLEPFIQYNVGRKEFSEALRNAGYDGVIYDNQEYIAFEPNQIKSATENVGSFDSENNDIRFRTAPAFYSNAERAVENVTQDKARFDALQQEYDALDKNDEAAVNAFNEKKKRVVKQYLDDVTERYALPCKNIQVFNEGDETEIFQVYQYVSNKFNQYKSRTGLKEPIPTFEDFKEMLKVSAAGYARYIDVILYPISAIPDEQNTFEEIVHEQIHAIIERLGISDRTKKRIWEEAKKSDFKYKDLIEGGYENDIDKGDEVLAYTINILTGPRRSMFEDFLNGNISVDDVLKSSKQSLPLRNEILKQILTYIENEQAIHNGAKAQGARNSGNTGNSGNSGKEAREKDEVVRYGRESVAHPRTGGDARRILDTVSQRGLRGIVSEDALEEFFKRVYNRVDNATRNDIYFGYAKHNGYDIWGAVEQYLASLAENGAPLNRGVRDAFVQMLQENGISAEGLTDNDIRYMMWRTNQLKDNKGALSVAEDVVMKQKLGVLQRVITPSFRVANNVITKEEYAVLSSEIMNRQYIQHKPSFDYAFTANNFYIYDFLGNNDVNINFVVPIEGNEDLIDTIYKSIDNGTINSPRSLDTFIEEIQGGKRGDIVYNTNALKKYQRNGGIHIRIPSRTSFEAGRVSQFGDDDSRGLTRRGASGNGYESANPNIDNTPSFRIVDDRRSIRDRYEKKVNTGKGKWKATSYNFQEAMQDEMLSLKIFQQILEDEFGMKIPSEYNVYNAENSLSSRNKEEMDKFESTLYEDMMEEIDNLVKQGATEQEIRDYVIAKSGIERSIEFTVRDYINEQAEATLISKKEAQEQLAEVEDKLENLMFLGRAKQCRLTP